MALIKKRQLHILIFVLFTATVIGQKNSEQSLKNWHGTHELSELKESPVALIPFPQKVQWGSSSLEVTSEIQVQYEPAQGSSFKDAIRSLKQIMKGSEIYIETDIKDSQRGETLIQFQLDSSMVTHNEGYSLTVNNNLIKIVAKSSSGAYYAVETLRQLLIPEKDYMTIPFCKIQDWPAFSLRGLMHDTGRNFRSIATLKEYIDRLANYKFNTFHWHLTDNPAWRVESEVYPELNKAENRRSGRDPNKSYSFDEIREVISYARKRNISIIPELDMPGHSEYFEPTFGFKMESEKGMKVLEDLIIEFCNEIPVEDCPIVHIGADEVHISNKKEFMGRMTRVLKNQGRTPMVWDPGLPPEDGTIKQLWNFNDQGVVKLDKSVNKIVDSHIGYLNALDPLSAIPRYFFQQICNQKEGDEMSLGGILCCWPDVRVDNKEKIMEQNSVWPGALTYSEAVWSGRPIFEQELLSFLPNRNTKTWKHFNEYEHRLAQHRDLYFKDEAFPFVISSHMEWNLMGPFLRDAKESADFSFDVEKSEELKKGKLVTGAVIRVEDVFNSVSLNDEPDQTVYASSHLHSDKDKEIDAWIGFETPTRDNRRSGGIPKEGKWDANGGNIWINGQALKAPHWKNPGANQYLFDTWHDPANEIPYQNEEFYWTREPSSITLKKGWNKILVRIPKAYKKQRWMFTFVPVKMDENDRWVEDLSIKSKANGG